MSGLAPLLAALNLIRRRVSKEIPIQQVVLLLTVAERPGSTMPELMRALDMPQGTLSRNVKALSQSFSRSAGGAVSCGYGLLRTVPSLQNPRMLAVYLTGRAEALLEDLARELNGGCAANRRRAGADRRSAVRPAVQSQ